MRIFIRVRLRIVREFKKYGFFGPSQLMKFSEFKNESRKLLIIGPGEMDIPPNGWGAVETLIWESAGTYEKKGIEVWILNSKKKRDWKRASLLDFRVVLCHGDNLALKVKKFFPNAKTIGITHYGYAAYPKLWHHSYEKTLEGLMKLDFICCLNNNIKEALSDKYPMKHLIVSSNGSHFRPRIGRNTNGSLLSLGKVEERKHQYEDYLTFKKYGISIKFIGEIVDPRVKKLMKNDQLARESFIGAVNRNVLARTLHQYSALFLNSKGEADALVLYEAQLAGLPIIVSEEAVGAQDSALPWIHILAKDFKIQDIVEFLSDEKHNPEEISTFAQKEYHWDVRNLELIKLVVDVFERSKK